MRTAKDNQDRTAVVYEFRDSTPKTKQIGQDNENRTQIQNSKGKRAVDKNAEAEELIQESLRRQLGWYRQDKKDRTKCQNMTEGQCSRDRTTEMEQLWLDSHDNKVGA